MSSIELPYVENDQLRSQLRAREAQLHELLAIFDPNSIKTYEAAMAEKEKQLDDLTIQAANWKNQYERVSAELAVLKDTLHETEDEESVLANKAADLQVQLDNFEFEISEIIREYERVTPPAVGSQKRGASVLTRLQWLLEDSVGSWVRPEHIRMPNADYLDPLLPEMKRSELDAKEAHLIHMNDWDADTF